MLLGRRLLRLSPPATRGVPDAPFTAGSTCNRALAPHVPGLRPGVALRAGPKARTLGPDCRIDGAMSAPGAAG